VQKAWKDIRSGSKSKTFNLPLSINDIRDKYFNSERLDEEERRALSRFDEYRIWYLNNSTGEEDFHKRYEELQAQANLSPFAEFLSDKYTVE